MFIKKMEILQILISLKSIKNIEIKKKNTISCLINYQRVKI